jgi:hypothetical protein
VVTIRSSVIGLMDQDKKVQILVVSIILVAIIDMELSNVSDIVSNLLSTSFGVISFTLIVMVYIVAQYFLVKYVKDKSTDIRTKQNVLQSVNRIVILAQYLLIFLFIVLILEIILTSEYYVGILMTVVEITNLLNIIIMVYDKKGPRDNLVRHILCYVLCNGSSCYIFCRKRPIF